jgi:hypothetical protein
VGTFDERLRHTARHSGGPAGPEPPDLLEVSDILTHRLERKDGDIINCAEARISPESWLSSDQKGYILAYTYEKLKAHRYMVQPDHSLRAIV